VIEGEPRSDWVFGLSLVQVLLLLGFAMMIIYVTDSVEGGGQESHQAVETRPQDANLQARLNADAEKNDRLEKQLGDMTLLIDELKLMVGAKVPSREAFQEAIENLKRGYALCQKDNNTLIEASIQNGVEAIHVIGEIPSELEVSLLKGDQTSDLDQIVSFVQDVYQYEKDHKCRFNYRLKYGTDNDYRKAREAYEKYFYPEKITRTG
jgi:archaellum component FlaC